jgi:hypothetical protein
VYLPFQLERIHHNFVLDGRYSERVWAPTLTRLGQFFHQKGMYARKWQLPLCVYSVGCPMQKYTIVENIKRPMRSHSYLLINSAAFINELQDILILNISLMDGSKTHV